MRAAPAVIDVALTLAVVGPLELARRMRGPSPVVDAARMLGRRMPRRAPERRAAMQRIIRLVDRAMPGGPNCFRRCILETALDRGAAEQRIVLGLKSHGGAGSGHAWLENAEDGAVYDAHITL